MLILQYMYIVVIQYCRITIWYHSTTTYHRIPPQFFFVRTECVLISWTVQLFCNAKKACWQEKLHILIKWLKLGNIRLVITRCITTEIYEYRAIFLSIYHVINFSFISDTLKPAIWNTTELNIFRQSWQCCPWLWPCKVNGIDVGVWNILQCKTV